ncbi:MAG: hypothetical protein ACXVJ7_08145 [Acidimicrobiia bacterium]
MRRVLAVALMGALTVSAAACGSDSQSKTLDAKPTVHERSQTSTSTLPFESSTKNTPGTLPDFVGAKADVHDTTCTDHAGTWRAAGSVTSSAKKGAHYRIYVSFLNGDTTVGLAQTDFGPVKPGATHDWTAGVKVSGTDLHCILRVERADA